MENKKYRTVRIEGLIASVLEYKLFIPTFELKIYDNTSILTIDALQNDNGIYDDITNYFWDNVYPDIKDVKIIDVDKEFEQNKNNMYLGLSNKYN